MNLNTGIIFVVLFIGIAWWQLYKASGRIFCTYTNPANQEITKWVKINSTKVVFDNKEFTILPEMHKVRWMKLFWGLLGNVGTWVICYDFAWDGIYPKDPNKYHISPITPESKRSINNSDALTDYNRAADKQSGRKQGLRQYSFYIFVGIALVGVAIYYLYSLHQQDIAQIKALQDALRLMNK